MAKKRKQIELYLTASVPVGTTLPQARHELKQRVNAPGWEHEEVNLKALAVVSNPYEAELKKLADQYGDRKDPFALWEDLQAMQAQTDLLKLVAEQAGKQFRYYERQHREKRTPEAEAKAVVNGCMAQICEDALAGKPIRELLAWMEAQKDKL